MGGAMAEGFVKSGLFAPADVTVSAPHKSTTDRFAALGVNATCDNREAAMGADVVVVAVKPWLVGEVVAEIKPVLDYSRQTILSVAAGVSGADLTAMLERDGGSLPPVFIAIPNIAIAIGCSMTYVLPVNTPGEGDTRRMADMFNAVGETMIIEERLLPAVVQKLLQHSLRHALHRRFGCRLRPVGLQGRRARCCAADRQGCCGHPSGQRHSARGRDLQSDHSGRLHHTRT